MNIFSNIGVTELVLILLLALIVVGPERLPEIGQKIGKTLRDIRKAYDSLARDIGPELASLQKTTQELRESVQAVQSIPQDAVKSLVRAADLEDTISEISGVADTVTEVGKTLSSTGRMLRSPVSAAVSTAQTSLLGTRADRSEGQREQAPALGPVKSESGEITSLEPHQKPSVAAVLEEASAADAPVDQESTDADPLQEGTVDATENPEHRAAAVEGESSE